MNNKLFALIFALICLAGSASASSEPVGTSITFEGSISNAGSPKCNFQRTEITRKLVATDDATGIQTFLFRYRSGNSLDEVNEFTARLDPRGRIHWGILSREEAQNQYDNCISLGGKYLSLFGFKACELKTRNEKYHHTRLVCPDVPFGLLGYFWGANDQETTPCFSGLMIMRKVGF